MIKRTVSLVFLLLALSVPSALADNGTVPAAPGPAAHADRGKQLAARMEKLRDRIQKVTQAFTRHCASGGKADADRCRAAAKKMLERLQRIDSRIDERVLTIKYRCGGGATAQAAQKQCAHADEVVQRLRELQGKVKQLEQKLQSWLAGQSSTGSGGSSSSDDGTGLESLDQLTADLAAVQAQVP